ncbi:MAG TPA: MFS transporter [Dehalococcoidia bacterium]|nr:MFS transporter [Dehalococcoidia bacterium]
MVVLAGALITFSETAFYNPVLGVFIPSFEKDFGWSRSGISAAVTCGALLGAAIAPIFGRMIDRSGGRLFVTCGGAVLALDLVGMALMQKEWQFIVLFAIGRGLAAGMITLALSVTVSKWFIRRRGFAVGVLSLGSRLGAAVLPISIQLIIEASSWRVAAFALAGLVATLGILPGVLWLHPHPEALRLEPDGSLTSPKKEQQARRSPEEDWTARDAIRTPAFWLLTMAVSLQSCCTGAINLHQIPHLIDRGLSAQTAALIAGVLALSSIAGALLEGVLDIRLGTRWTMVIGLVGSATGVVVLINVNSTGMGLFYGAWYGLAFGLMLTSSQIVLADYFGRTSLGTIRGISAPFQMGFNAAGPLIAGIVYDATGSYSAAFTLFALSFGAAAISLTIARRPHPIKADVGVKPG